jgi:hypothetical protein
MDESRFRILASDYEVRPSATPKSLRHALRIDTVVGIGRGCGSETHFRHKFAMPSSDFHYTEFESIADRLTRDYSWDRKM